MQSCPRRQRRCLRRAESTSCTPPQAEAVKAGLLGGKSVLVSAPTASGKTLVAVLAMMAHLSSRRRGKIVYLSPLRALASEKFAEFRRIGRVVLGGKKARVMVSTGETGQGARIGDADILVLTNERMDALLRQDPKWAARIGLVVADEVHMIGDPFRGATLEMILARMRLSKRAPQIVGLSATMTNAAEIAKWLGARLVDSDWRPVQLREGVHHGASITMADGSRRRLRPSSLGAAVDIGVEAVKEGGQSLVFAETRALSVSLAEKAAPAVSGSLGGEDRAELAAVAAAILASAENTQLVKTLAGLVRKGVAFHHAGLAQPSRAAVEAAFRARRIRLLASTPTLAAGVNLPARRVVVSSILRYDPSLGKKAPISVLEYKQLCGRAGRPQYDEYGEAIAVSPRSYKKDQVMRRYVRGRPQPVRSQLASAAAMRTHVLSLVAMSPGIKKSEAARFFAGTLAGLQSRAALMRDKIDIAIESLARLGLVCKKGARLHATDLGSMASLLYLDPDTAALFRDAIEAAPRAAAPGGGGSRRKPAAPRAAAPRRPERLTLGLLHEITSCSMFFPKVYMRESDYYTASRLARSKRGELFMGTPRAGRSRGRSGWWRWSMPEDTTGFNRSLLALDAWLGEDPEARIAGRLGVESGDMHRIVESAEWLAYCMGRLAGGLGRPDLARELAVLRARIRHGIGEELVELASVRGVGRVRARRLHRRGIDGKAALASASVRKIASIDGIGAALAVKIKSQASRGRGTGTGRTGRRR